MKNLQLLLICFISITFSNCSNNSENQGSEIKTEIELLTQKKWNFSYFDFMSSPTSIIEFTIEEIEQSVNNTIGEWSIEFNEDMTGNMFYSDGSSSFFNWQKNENILIIQHPNEPNRSTEYILNSVTTEALNITYNHSAIFFINDIEVELYGDYFFE